MGAGRPQHRTLKLAAIGTAGGLFSGVFGVGGGAVVVPLLLAWLAYGEREAAATSLGAIAIVAGFAAALQGVYGNVDVTDALVIGIPAVGGVVGGTWLQQRLPADTIALAFALLLVVAAIELALSS
jgi:uncharacterized membrane protein YfcA